MKIEQRGAKGSKEPGASLGRIVNPRVTAYTLAEVLMAVVILTVISTAFYSALSSGFSVIETAREDVRATQILTQKLEALRLCRWDQLTNLASFNFSENYDPLSTNASGTVFYGTVVTNAATAISDSTGYKANMRLVRVTLSWTNYTGGRAIAHQREMDSYVALYGLQNYIWGAR